MKKTILLATMTAMLAAGSAMARPAGPISYSSSIYCATREAGNPYSRYCDYIAWSGWRRRGGWDASLDNACLTNPHFVPYGCSARF
jgi:hypothetical protein